MRRPDDHDYYVRREREEKRMAAIAGDSCVRRVHAWFADEYARRVARSQPPAAEDMNTKQRERMSA